MADNNNGNDSSSSSSSSSSSPFPSSSSSYASSSSTASTTTLQLPNPDTEVRPKREKVPDIPDAPEDPSKKAASTSSSSQSQKAIAAAPPPPPTSSLKKPVDVKPSESSTIDEMQELAKKTSRLSPKTKSGLFKVASSSPPPDSSSSSGSASDKSEDKDKGKTKGKRKDKGKSKGKDKAKSKGKSKSKSKSKNKGKSDDDKDNSKTSNESSGSNSSSSSSDSKKANTILPTLSKLPPLMGIPSNLMIKASSTGSAVGGGSKSGASQVMRRLEPNVIEPPPPEYTETDGPEGYGGGGGPPVMTPRERRRINQARRRLIRGSVLSLGSENEWTEGRKYDAYATASELEDYDRFNDPDVSDDEDDDEGINEDDEAEEEEEAERRAAATAAAAAAAAGGGEGNAAAIECFKEEVSKGVAGIPDLIKTLKKNLRDFYTCLNICDVFFTMCVDSVEYRTGVGANNGIGYIIAAVKQNREEPDLCMSALRALRYINLEHRDNIRLSVTAGVVRMVSYMLKNYAEHAGVCRWACLLLATLTWVPENQRAVTPFCVTLLVRVLKRHVDTPDTCDAALCAVANITRGCRDNQDKFIVDDGVGVLLAALRAHKLDEDGSIVSHACAAIIYMAAHYDAYLAARGAVTVVVDALKHSTGYPRVLARLCWALEALGLRDDGCRAAISKAKTMPYLVKALGDYPGDRDLCLHALGAIQSATFNNVPYKRLALRLGAPARIIELLAQHAADPPVIARALGTLAVLAVDPLVREQILDPGNSNSNGNDSIIRTVLDTLSGSQSVRVAEQGCKLIRAIAWNSAAAKSTVADAGGLVAVLQALDAHSDAPCVCEAACQAVATLVVNSRERQDAVAGAGGVAFIVRCMKNNIKFPTACLACCEALDNLCYKNDPNKLLFMQASGARLLMKVFRTYSSRLHLCSQICLFIENLAFSPECRRKLFDKNVPLMILALMRLHRENYQKIIAKKSGSSSDQINNNNNSNNNGSVGVKSNGGGDNGNNNNSSSSNSLFQAQHMEKIKRDTVVFYGKCLIALRALCWALNEAKEAVVKDNGVYLITAIMDTHREDEALVTEALKTIVSLCNSDDPAANLAALKKTRHMVVINLMRAHVGNPEILRYACFILNGLVRGIPDAYRRIEYIIKHCSSISHLLCLVFDSAPKPAPSTSCQQQLRDSKKPPRRKSSAAATTTAPQKPQAAATTAATEQKLTKKQRPPPQPPQEQNQPSFSASLTSSSSSSSASDSDEDGKKVRKKAAASGEVEMESFKTKRGDTKKKKGGKL